MRTALEKYVAGAGAPPSLATLRHSGLAAWAYATSPDRDARLAPLRPDFLAMVGRHQRIKQELLPLLHAWQDHGIVALLFKGFWLSERYYPTAGLRFHGDVDVMLPADQLELARQTCRSLDWEIQDEWAIPSYSHTGFNAAFPGRHTCVDVHRLLIHSRHRANDVQVRITRAMWQASVKHAWCGVSVKELMPADALLLIALQRCWGEGWQLKPADALDARVLVQRTGVTKRELLTRARQLGCQRTAALFLERCDPWAQRAELDEPGLLQVAVLDRLVARERPCRKGDTLRRLLRAPLVVADMVRVLPSILAVMWRVRQHRDISDLLQALTPSAGVTRTTPAWRARTIRGVSWLARLAGSSCLVRSLALYRALRREGWPVTFVSGVAMDEGRIKGHAWIELEGQLLPLLPEAVFSYRTLFRYPG